MAQTTKRQTSSSNPAGLHPVLDAALTYLEQGIAVLPIRGGTGDDAKKPLLPAWKTYQDRLPTEREARDWFRKWPNADLGIICGWKGLAVVDIDDPELACRIVQDTKLLAQTMVATTPSGGLHIHLEEQVTSKNGPIIPGVADIKAAGGYVVSPPSRNREWIDNNAPERLRVRNAREWGEEMLAKFGVEVGCEEPPPDRKAGGGKVREGARHTHLVSLAGRLRYQGFPIEEIEEDLLRENKRRCVPPLPQSEVIQIADSMANYDPGPMPLTDLGNAERLVARHGNDLRYCHELGTWYVWRGTHWGENDDGEVERRANETARSIRLEAEHATDPDRTKKLFNHALKSEAHYSRQMMIRMAQDLEGIPTPKETFNRNPLLLNVSNGTIDLATGELLEHDREDMLTTLIPLTYSTDAKAPRWLQFLDEIFEEDAALIEYVQRAVGYSLTGDVSEQILFLCYGKGANGKSILLDAITRMMGSYARVTDPELLLARSGESHPTGMADLFGKRMATTMETKKGRSFNESKLKWLTGGDKLTARKMRQDFFEFFPTHKLWIATNHLPNVELGGEAFWRRIIAIPFNRVFTAKEQDPGLADVLAEEANGILAWAVRGSVAWCAGAGLKTHLPKAIRRAKGKYQRDNDQIGRFLEDRCDFEDHLRIGSQALYDVYKRWCDETGEGIVLSQKEWSQEMERQGIGKKKTSAGTVWVGLGVRLTWDE